MEQDTFFPLGIGVGLGFYGSNLLSLTYRRAWPTRGQRAPGTLLRSFFERLAQPADNTKINKQDTSPKELTADQQGETKQDRKIRSVQGLKIVGLSENPAQTVINTTGLTLKEPAPSVVNNE